MCGNVRASVSNKWRSRCKSSVGRYCHGSCLLLPAVLPTLQAGFQEDPTRSKWPEHVHLHLQEVLFPVHSSEVDPKSLRFGRGNWRVCGWWLVAEEATSNPAEASNLLPPLVFSTLGEILYPFWVSFFLKNWEPLLSPFLKNLRPRSSTLLALPALWPLFHVSYSYHMFALWCFPRVIKASATLTRDQKGSETQSKL